MSIEKAIADLQAALEDNTKAMRELTAITRSAHTTGVGVAQVSVSPAGDVQMKPDVKETKATAGEAITYKQISEAFLALIAKVGTAAEAKRLALDPLGLADLKSNKEKTELFPKILAKIEEVSKAAAV